VTSNEGAARSIPPVSGAEISPSQIESLADACAHEHLVQFYESDEVLERAVATFIGDALQASRAGVVVATSEHRRAIERLLVLDGIDIVDAVQRGMYVSHDAGDTLARFMADGMPDRELFQRTMQDILTPAIVDNGRVHVFGEMVAVLVEEGRYRAAIALEHLWNELHDTVPFSLLCAYPMVQGGEALTGMFETIIDAHTHVIPAESYAALSTHDDRDREIALLQLKALWLEREIAERKHAQERLRFALASEQTARRETEDALRVRDEFLSIAAHELKTPLAGLNGHAQLAMRAIDRDAVPSDSVRVRRSLEIIAERAQKLSRLLDQLLDTSRIEAGYLELELEAADLVALVHRVAETTRLVAYRQSITVTAPPELEADVDLLRLEQVLLNLIDNAIRHSPDGGRIDIVLARPAPEVVELTVRDQGPGIDVEHRERIFDRYYKLHCDGKANGLGLGLHLCRQIVELHGGSIRVECPDDGGSAFIANLPIHAPAPTVQLIE
jgi:signal transduction histidine kinase